MLGGCSKVLLVLTLLGPGVSAWAQSRWEVAVLFLASQENADYQKDIDHNILELARSHPNQNYQLSFYREFKNRSVSYFVNPQAVPLSRWDTLFETKPPQSIKVPGVVIDEARDEQDLSLIQNSEKLKGFFAEAYRDRYAKRILIIYSHGAAFEGLGNKIGLKEIEGNLSQALPPRAGKPVDILWFDACFMGNLETAYQMRRLAPLYVASEEAEFSSAEPFDMLKILAFGPDDPRRVAIYLAERFVESYSYLKRGSQRKNVLSSSATISVLSTDRLEALVKLIAELKVAIGKLTPQQRKEIQSQLIHLSMDRADLHDLGSLLLAISRGPAFKVASIEKSVEELRILLDLGRPEKFRTNPRLMIEGPVNNKKAPMVFGYNEWTRAYRGDAESLRKLPASLREDLSFVSGGPFGREWPAKTLPLQQPFYFSPFSVDLNLFHYYFIDPTSSKLISKVLSYKRSRDFVFLRAESSSNPILLSGYTQGMGEFAERYLGLSILDPSNGVTSMDYVDLDFAELTGWGNLF